MKKLIFIILFLIFCPSLQAKDFESKRFKAIFTVTFNSLTLEEIANKEILINKRFKDACAIDLDIKESRDEDEGGVLMWDAGAGAIVVD